MLQGRTKMKSTMAKKPSSVCFLHRGVSLLGIHYKVSQHTDEYFISIIVFVTIFVMSSSRHFHVADILRFWSVRSRFPLLLDFVWEDTNKLPPTSPDKGLNVQFPNFPFLNSEEDRRYLVWS